MKRLLESNFETTTEIEGLVLPAEWDAVGEATAFKISSPGESSYLVVGNPEGRSLKSLLRQYVRVLGKVSISSTGEPIIWIERILQHD